MLQKEKCKEIKLLKDSVGKKLDTFLVEVILSQILIIFWKEKK